MSDLTSLLVSILPYAIGALFSPLILYNLLNTVPDNLKPRLAVFAYLFGSILIFVILVLIGLYLGSTLFGTLAMPILIGSIIEITLGSILILISVKLLFVREEVRTAGIIGFINTLKEDNNLSFFIKFSYTGFITILASFTTAILFTVAGIIIGISNPGSANSAIIIITLGFISLLTLEIPFIFYLLSPKTADESLDRFRSLIPAYGDNLTGIVYFLLGIFFLIRGFFSV
ncbi:MAG: GAP family protein [Methanobacterium sp.]